VDCAALGASRDTDEAAGFGTAAQSSYEIRIGANRVSGYLCIGKKAHKAEWTKMTA